MSPLTIMVVEDEPLVLESTSQTLSDAGFQVIPARIVKRR